MSRYTINIDRYAASPAKVQMKARNKDEVIAMLCAYITDTTGDRAEVSQ